MPEDFPNPNEIFVNYMVRLRCLQRLEQELAKFLRNQTIVNDIKRRCGVSTSEGK